MSFRTSFRGTLTKLNGAFQVSEVAAAVPGILREGSHNTTVHQPPFFD